MSAARAPFTHPSPLARSLARSAPAAHLRLGAAPLGGVTPTSRRPLPPSPSYPRSNHPLSYNTPFALVPVYLLFFLIFYADAYLRPKKAGSRVNVGSKDE